MVSLEIQHIEREPLGARKYMGPERYIVHIPLITLEPINMQEKPVEYQNATITMRKHAASRSGWRVDEFSEISLFKKNDAQ